MRMITATIVLLSTLLWAPFTEFTETGAAALGRSTSQADEAAAAARATLARLPAEARLEEIRHEQLRLAVQATYRAVVELADNRDSGKVGALNTKFERAFALVEREARGEHKICAENCKAVDGETCLTKCRANGQKFCGCKLIVFGCIVAECLL